MPIRRTLKNVVKNYSDAQIKVREATSNDPWGPSSTLMSEIADLTYNVVAFTEIMQMVWKRLNDHGKNWRHVYKALVLLDYLIKTGSEKVAQQCKENIFTIQTLKDFQYVEDGKDHGMNVRERAKQLVSLLKDDERLKNERAKALKAKERFAQNAMGVGSGTTVSNRRGRHGSGSPTMHSGYTDSFGGDDNTRAHQALPTSYSDPSLAATTAAANTELEAARPSTVGEEELQLQLALAMSKEEHDEDEKRRKADEIKYQMAIEESKKVHENEELPSQDSLLDLAQGGQDPWGAPAAAAATTPDSWGGVPKTASSDPWTAPSATVGPLATPNNDPWIAVSVSGTQLNTSGKPPVDPWGDGINGHQKESAFSPLSTTPGTNGVSTQQVGGIDDEFDLLSTIRTKAMTTSAPNKTGDANDILGTKSDPWDMSGITSELPKEQQKPKSPADFLGENANLVNLDNLVTRPASARANLILPFPADTTNPFAMTLNQPPSNPFQNSAPPRVPMNQMQQSTSMGFEQTGSTILPAPLVPVAGAAPGMAPVQPIPPQGYNPFL
ncbi:hypothetical protein LSH36_320g02112 [Paralvinella palmiformis]|uniref:ENTH domain-containing protein n=1 Tax=Paralvinella palmiformis TaxID=53620 RepID=A0AAD9JH96_9ANNE|nr:hypothetical protein LSH36_320g02112 [Paralvinella palmiformis]